MLCQVKSFYDMLGLMNPGYYRLLQFRSGKFKLSQVRSGYVRLVQVTSSYIMLYYFITGDVW